LIRSSALLTVVAMAMLVAGVSAANLGLIYLSIAVSIVAAVTLAVGVLLRRRELFGEAGAATRSAQLGWPAAETAKARPVPVQPAAGDRVPADRGSRRKDDRRDGEQQGDVAARLRKAGSGTAADAGPARWPASIAAKGASETARRGGEHPAGRGRAARSPSGREPAAREPGAREPARDDWAGRERGDPEPAGREPAAREAMGRESVPTGSTGRGAGWPPPRPGREAGPGRPATPGRDRASAGRNREAGRDQDPAAARPDREHAGRGRGRGGERDRAAAARADRPRAASVQDRDQAAAARRDREHAGRDEAAAGQAEAFRLPPQSERTRARAEELGRAIPGGQAGDDFWDRVSGEHTGSGSQDPARPAWPATAGPRAMGTGSGPWDRDASPRLPGEEHDRDEEPAGAGAGPRQDRMVPPYVDDLARSGGQKREPERQPAGADEPGNDAAGAGATAGPGPGGAWSEWSSVRAERQDTGAEEAGRDPADRGAAHDERVSLHATAGAAAGTQTDAAGETGDHEAEAGVQGDETADRAEPAGAAEPSPGGEARSDAERPGDADDTGETAGRTAAEQSAAEPGRTRDAAGTSKAADTGDAGDADKGGGAASAGADGSSLLDDEVAVVPGVPRYHRRGCILIRFLSDGDLETTTRREAEAAGSVPCKACQPDKPASAG